MSCIAQTVGTDSQKFCFGLYQREGLIVNEEWIISTSKNENGEYQRIEYNLITKEIKVSKKDGQDSDFICEYIANIERSSLVDISNNGLHWEGCCLNNSPFGYGSLYNNENELIYRGVMIRDNKECFGIEFYPSLGIVEYIGCYWNNERHGFGMLYDRKGELLHQNIFMFDSSDYETHTVLKDFTNECSLHSLICELMIDEECGNELNEDFVLSGFDKLESLVVMKKSLAYIKSLRISNNPVLKSIKTEDGGYEKGAFYYVKSVVIAGSLMIN